jgi:regulator of chromosome condensation
MIIDSCFASGNYCYVLHKETNQLYSWGMGYSYVLGTRDEENEFKPYTVHPKMFEENQVMMMGTGTQHVVCLTTDDPEKKQLP